MWFGYHMPAMAQPRLNMPHIYIGVHGGVMGSMMYWNPRVVGTQDLMGTALLGGNGGLVFRYTEHKVCALQIELNYIQRGWRETDEEAGVAYSRTLDCIQLPLLTHLYFGKKSFRGFFNLGPQISYCINERESGTKHPTYTAQYAPIDHPFDWGLAAGLGCYIHTPKAGIYQLEARFNYSLSDTFSNSKMAYFSSSHAMVASVNFAYLFEIKVKKKKR